MAEETELQQELQGYIFTDEKQRNRAIKELDAIRYIMKNIDPDQPGMILEIYKQILDQRLLHTPVGLDFLQELYEYLIEVPLLEEMEIPRPPVLAEAETWSGLEAGQELDPELELERVMELERGLEPELEPEPVMSFDLPEGDIQAERRARMEEEGRLSTLQAQVKQWRERCRRLQAAIVVLVIIVVAMFAISLTSGSTTILNYENKIIDKYEEWELELQQREEAVKEREEALGQ